MGAARDPILRRRLPLFQADPPRPSGLGRLALLPSVLHRLEPGRRRPPSGPARRNDLLSAGDARRLRAGVYSRALVNAPLAALLAATLGVLSEPDRARVNGVAE